MIDQPENLQGFLENCTYSEFLTELAVDVDRPAPLVDYITDRTPADIDALVSATYRFPDEGLEDEDLLLLDRVRELCFAHVALLELATSDEASLNVDPRRLFALSDDDLFAIAHYAELVVGLRTRAQPYFPKFAIDRDMLTTTIASVLAATVARGYDPPPTSDPFVRCSFGRHIMWSALAAGDPATIIAAIRNLPQYAARCAAPRFAASYVPGSLHYDQENAEAILTAVLVAADDGSDDEQLEDEEQQ